MCINWDIQQTQIITAHDIDRPGLSRYHYSLSGWLLTQPDSCGEGECRGGAPPADSEILSGLELGRPRTKHTRCRLPAKGRFRDIGPPFLPCTRRIERRATYRRLARHCTGRSRATTWFGAVIVADTYPETAKPSSPPPKHWCKYCGETLQKRRSHCGAKCLRDDIQEAQRLRQNGLVKQLYVKQAVWRRMGLIPATYHAGGGK